MSELAGRRGDVIASELSALPILSPPLLLLIFDIFGELCFVFSTSKELSLKGVFPAVAALQPNSCSLSVPDGAGAAVWDGLWGQLGAADGPTCLQTPHHKIVAGSLLCWVGK